MKIYVLLLFFSLPLVSFAGGRCTGNSSCRACTSCNYCQHCNSGGSCGVCGGGTSSRSYSSDPYSSRSHKYNSYSESTPTYNESSDYSYSYDESDESDFNEPEKSRKLGWFWLLIGGILFYYVFLRE